MSWAAGLPVVSVPQGDQPKTVTIVLPYYDNPRFLEVQRHRWRTFPGHLRQHLRAIICDDASPTTPAKPDQMAAFPSRVFRNMGPDLPWNWLSARNRGAYESEEGWLLMTDMDHVLPQSTAESLIYGKHDPGIVHAFSRVEHDGKRITPHSASFFLTKALFWQIGGYDERYAGVYGTDGLYRRRLREVAPLVVLEDRLIRYEYQDDSSTTAYQRKLKSDDMKREAITKAITGPPHVLTFPYVEVL